MAAQTNLTQAAPRHPVAPAPITICHIVLRLAMGGLENGLVMLINNLPAERYKHIIVCLEAATEFRARIRRDDVALYELHKRPGKDLPMYGRVWRLLRELRPDVVHTRNLPTIDMLAAARLAGIAVLIHSEHGLDMVEIARPAKRYLLLRRLSRMVVDRYLAVSRDMADWLHGQIGIPLDRIAVVYNGVDNETFRPRRAEESRDAALPPGFAPPGAFVIGTVGRLEPVKDQTTLARAFVLALKRRPELREVLRLVIVGDGRLRNEVESVLASAGAADLAWLPGFQDRTDEIYRSLDLFVSPSRREGTSNTILEAMASGLAVVATAVGGNTHLVTENETGRLVPPEQPSALAEAILDYAGDRETAAAHGRAGRARVLRDFSIDAMVRGYDALYARQIKPRRPRGGRR